MAWTELTRRQHDREGGRYASDLTDAEWAVIGTLMPPRTKTGRPRTTACGMWLTQSSLYRHDGMPMAHAAQGLPAGFDPDRVKTRWSLIGHRGFGGFCLEIQTRSATAGLVDLWGL